VERVTLSAAIAGGDLEPFIRQAEADGLGEVDEAFFGAIVGCVIKAPRPSDQTSRSPARGGLRGK
jgi:hypothetical protein